MRTSRNPLPTLSLVLGLLLAGCGEPPTAFVMDGTALGAAPAPALLGSSDDPGAGMVTVPFKAKFWTEPSSLIFDDCAPGIGLYTQEGEGTGTHLGTLTTKMVFCFDFNPGPDFGTYWFLPGDENGYFMAANGDKLFITVPSGQVFFDPSVGPDYVAWWRDPFLVTGGTGRFEGASGGGMLDSYLQANGITADHTWTGEVTMRRPVR